MCRCESALFSASTGPGWVAVVVLGGGWGFLPEPAAECWMCLLLEVVGALGGHSFFYPGRCVSCAALNPDRALAGTCFPNLTSKL